jgi:hypothetical protein
LSALASKACVFVGSPNPVFTDASDVAMALKVVDDLSDFITWIARYPTPMSATQHPNYPVSPLSPAWGDDLRRWTDPILDHLHGILPPGVERALHLSKEFR